MARPADDLPVERSRIVELAERGIRSGLYVLWIAPTPEQLPSTCSIYTVPAGDERPIPFDTAIELIADDELVEITPKSIRIRKRHLLEHERKKASREAA